MYPIPSLGAHKYYRYPDYSSSLNKAFTFSNHSLFKLCWWLDYRLLKRKIYRAPLKSGGLCGNLQANMKHKYKDLWNLSLCPQNFPPLLAIQWHSCMVSSGLSDPKRCIYFHQLCGTCKKNKILTKLCCTEAELHQSALMSSRFTNRRN